MVSISKVSISIHQTTPTYTSNPHPPKKTNKRTHKPTQQPPSKKIAHGPWPPENRHPETLEAPKAGFRPPLLSLAASKTPRAPGSFFRYAGGRFHESR